MTKEIAIMHVKSELKLAEQAITVDNIGKARVCVRRACGIAIEYWLKFNPNKKWGLSAISMLDNLQNDFAIPEEIREAAKRLTKKVNQNFETGVEVDPIKDGETIIEYFLDIKNLNEI